MYCNITQDHEVGHQKRFSTRIPTDLKHAPWLSGLFVLMEINVMYTPRSFKAESQSFIDSKKFAKGYKLHGVV